MGSLDAAVGEVLAALRRSGQEENTVVLFAGDNGGELGGARPDPAYPLDGTSLAGHLLRGEDVAERDLFWRVRANRALRRGDWKYYRDAAGADHLYNPAAVSGRLGPPFEEDRERRPVTSMTGVDDLCGMCRESRRSPRTHIGRHARTDVPRSVDVRLRPPDLPLCPRAQGGRRAYDRSRSGQNSVGVVSADP